MHNLITQLPTIKKKHIAKTIKRTELLEQLCKIQTSTANAIIEDITNYFKDYNGNQHRLGKLKAPTGSGKTMIMSRVIQEIMNVLKKHMSFIWISFEKGGLSSQSYDKIKSYIGHEVEIISSSDIKNVSDLSGKVLVIHWEEINRTDEKGNSTNKIMGEDGDYGKLPSICAATHYKNIPITLIIDEADFYASTNKSKSIIKDYFKPAYTFEMSATLNLNDADFPKKITIDEARKYALIKKNVRRTTFNSPMESLKLGYEALSMCLNKTKDCGAQYFPKWLIFLENINASGGEKATIDFILNYLNDNYRWTEESGEIVVWTSSYKSKNYEQCKNNLNKCKVILTKEAISVGVDIPSIQVITQLRPTNSIRVGIQRIGRGFRMPEIKFYDNELDTLYFHHFSEAELSFEGMEELEEILLNQSQIKEDYKILIDSMPNITKTSIARIESIVDEDQDDFDNIFVPAFELVLSSQNMNEFNHANIFATSKKDGILNVENGDIYDDTITNYHASEDVINEQLNRQTRKVLGHAIKHFKSIFSMIGAWLDEHKKYQNVHSTNIFILNNIDRIAQLIHATINNVNIERDLNRPIKIEQWKMPTTLSLRAPIHNQYKKHIHYPFFDHGGKSSNPEKLFTNFLESCDKVIGWQRNYGKNETSYSVVYSDVDGRQQTFYPDYIVFLASGNIMICDTTAGTIDRNKEIKRKALIEQLEQDKNKNVFGGIIKYEDNNFHFQGKNDKISPLSDIL